VPARHRRACRRRAPRAARLLQAVAQPPRERESRSRSSSRGPTAEVKLDNATFSSAFVQTSPLKGQREGL
jgi:hypothetical protein